MDKFKYEIDNVDLELYNTDEVYVEISREDTRKMYEEIRKWPINDNSEYDDSYVSGELQFIFDKGTDHLTEVLLFPVYEDENEEEFFNGDFIYPPGDVFNYTELIDDVKGRLLKARGKNKLREAEGKSKI